MNDLVKEIEELKQGLLLNCKGYRGRQGEKE